MFKQAGYDTVNSTNFFVIPGSNNASYIPQLKSTSNVNVPGRWAFRVDGIQKCMCFIKVVYYYYLFVHIIELCVKSYTKQK